MIGETRARPELAAKVAFLLRRAFPEPPEAIETHMSWVFLTPDHAFKLKKPVKHPFLDHRTIEARRLDCEAEVALNSSLAPGVYRGTVPLTWEPGSRLALDGEGEVVDWVVVMRQLPEASMLNRRLATDGVERSEVEALVGHLVAFYRSTPAVPTTPARYRQALEEILSTDRAELLQPDHALDEDRIHDLTDRLRSAVQSHPALDDRSGRIVDGHGDLRPEHVLVGTNPLVIDRITFDHRLRLIDPLCDLALLAVECEFLGVPELGDDITTAYLERTGDPASPATSALYRSLRATTRARLTVAHLGDSDRDAGKWLDRTDSYVAIAERHLDHYATMATGDDSGLQVQ